MLVASTSVVGFNCTAPAASSWRTLPWQPRASARSRRSASGLRGGRRPMSTSTAFLLEPRSPAELLSFSTQKVERRKKGPA